MKNFRLVSVVTVVSVGFAAGYLSSCGQTGDTTCSSICQGCCDSAGLCQQGTLAAACGVGAAMCQQCTSAQLCVSGTCQEVVIVDSGVTDAGVPDSGTQMTGDAGTCKPGMFCGRVHYNGSKTGVLVNFVLHNSDPIAGPPSKTAKMDAGTFPLEFEFPTISYTGNPLPAGNYYFITWLDVMAGDSTSGPNYMVDPVYPPKTMPTTPQPKQVIPASGGATPLEITLQDP